MNAVITAPFGDPDAIRAAKAANAAFVRAVHLGYSTMASRQFARMAKQESVINTRETPREIAMRIVLPKTATFAGNPGGLA